MKMGSSGSEAEHTVNLVDFLSKLQHIPGVVVVVVVVVVVEALVVVVVDFVVLVVLISSGFQLGLKF